MQSIVTAGQSYSDHRARRQLLPDATGRRVLLGREVERVVVDASAARASSYQAYAVMGGELKPLPAGASFDPRRGILYWQPGVGYTGDYDFAIVTDRHTRIPGTGRVAAARQCVTRHREALAVRVPIDVRRREPGQLRKVRPQGSPCS